jgi:hypothetical protein
MKKRLLATAAVLLGTLLAGCGHSYIAASYGPPPPRYGAMGYAPGPGYMWADGYWDRAGSGWNWVGGRWVMPPHGRAVWVRPEWRREGNRWRFHRGYWR